VSCNALASVGTEIGHFFICLGSGGLELRMLDLTYGHLIKGSETTARERLDAFVSREHNQQVEARWHGSTAT
jgi:hypothetical protein